MEKKSAHRRDAGVELLRLFACLIVVGVHTCLPAMSTGTVDTGRQFLGCMLADGVAMFWMITGFFLLHNSSYAKVLRRSWRTVALPSVVFSVVIYYLGPWLMQGSPLPQSMMHTPQDYQFVANTLLSWNNPVAGVAHLWYVYAYVLLILLFPVLQSFAAWLDGSPRRAMGFLAASFLFFAWNDISGNALAGFSHHSLNAVFPAAVELLWGHILYRFRSRFASRWWALAGLSAFVVLNLVRTGLLKWQYAQPAPNTAIVYWFSCFGLLCMVSLMVFCFAVIPAGTDTRFTRGLCRVASLTFLVYLFHPVVNTVLNRFGVQAELQAAVFTLGDNFVAEALYTVAVIALVGGISLVCGACVQGVARGLGAAWHRLRPEKQPAASAQ